MKTVTLASIDRTITSKWWRMGSHGLLLWGRYASERARKVWLVKARLEITKGTRYESLALNRHLRVAAAISWGVVTTANDPGKVTPGAASGGFVEGGSVFRFLHCRTMWGVTLSRLVLRAWSGHPRWVLSTAEVGRLVGRPALQESHTRICF